MYEPLLAYNTLTGQVEPLLGRLVSQSTEGVQVVLHPQAKWNDGKPVTATDVKFIYQLGKRFKGASTAYVLDYISDIKVDTVEEGGAKAERLTFVVNKAGRNNPLMVMDILQAIRIVPSHIFEPMVAGKRDLTEVLKLKIDKAPVVSGPYTLHAYSNEKIVLQRRADYWGNAALHQGKAPVPEYIIHPIYKSNDAFAIALQKGDLDASQTFIPRIWLKKGDKVHTWQDKAPYFLPGAVPMLLINTTKPPLDDRNFRRAMAHAIDYKAIQELAVSGYSPGVKPGAILPFGVEGKYYDEEAVRSVGAAHALEDAKKLLEASGYKSVFKPDGTLDHMVNAKGERVPTLFVKSPAGWSDWEAMVSLAVKGMRAAGIDVREGFVDASLYWPALPTGDFDLIMHKPASQVTPSLPWSRFEALMSSRNWVSPGSGKMNENQGRYNNPQSKGYNPRVDELLRAIPNMTDDVALKAAYTELNTIFMQDQPALPLCYLPEQFYEYSTRHWTGWQNEQNPFAPPLLPWIGAATQALWQLQPVK
ncbi:ABC transporter substrate-binding protein [Candidatus Symbiobacter mobilis]|nr:ABC transporter substrate-binding protein [Candidatus Symbiobacter mobilis]